MKCIIVKLKNQKKIKNMRTDLIKKAVEKDENLSETQKNFCYGYLSRMDDDRNEEIEVRKLIEDVYKLSKSVRLGEVFLSNDDVKIFEINSNDIWDKEFPYRSIVKIDGVWRRTSKLAPTFDTAFLIYLEEKYLDSNSSFSDFALKMLEIKIDGYNV